MLPSKEKLHKDSDTGSNDETMERICSALSYMISGLINKGFRCFSKDLVTKDLELSTTDPNTSMERFMESQAQLLDEVKLKFNLTEEEVIKVLYFSEEFYDKAINELTRKNLV